MVADKINRIFDEVAREHQDFEESYNGGLIASASAKTFDGINTGAFGQAGRTPKRPADFGAS